MMMTWRMLVCRTDLVMRFHGLDLNLLVALNALLTEKSISRAAAKVHLSQPAMSNALSRLRDYFHDELLSSSGRNLTLTARAEALVAPVREVLVRIESTIATSPDFDPIRESRTFNIQVSDYSTTVFMPALIEHLYAQAPEVRLNLHPLDARQAGAVEQGDVDLLIIPTQYVLPGHPSVPLFEEEFVCVGWSQNDAVGDELTVEKFLAAGHVISHFGNKAPTMDGMVLDQYGFSRRVEITAASLAGLPAFVVGTRRIATVHRRVANMYARNLPIRIWEMPIKLPNMVQAMQWHKHRTNDAALSWLRQCAQDVATKHFPRSS